MKNQLYKYSIFMDIVYLNYKDLTAMILYIELEKKKKG